MFGFSSAQIGTNLVFYYFRILSWIFFFFLVCFERVWQNSSEKGCLCFSWLALSVCQVDGGEGKEEMMPTCRLKDSWQSTWLACCKGADLQPSLRGQGEDTFLETQRETLWRLLQPRKAVQIAGLQSIWKERLILEGNRKKGEDLFSKLLFICIIQKICICSILRGCLSPKKT